MACTVKRIVNSSFVWSVGMRQVEMKGLASIDHTLQNLIDRILVFPRPIRHFSAHFLANTMDKAGGAGVLRIAWRIRKQSLKVRIV